MENQHCEGVGVVLGIIMVQGSSTLLNKGSRVSLDQGILIVGSLHMLWTKTLKHLPVNTMRKNLLI